METGQQTRVSRAPEAAILGLAIFIVLAIGTLTFLNSVQTRNRIVQTRAVRDVQKLNARLLLTVTDAETAQRGFLLSGREDYLQPYYRALAEVGGTEERLEARSALEPEQLARIKAIEPLVAEKLAELTRTVDLTHSGQVAAAIEVVKSDKGIRLMSRIRAAAAEINQACEQRSLEFNAESDMSNSRLRIGSTLGGLLLLSLIFVSATIISRGFKRREELLHEAQGTRELLATTLSSIADAVITTDEEARITFVNPVAERLTGWTDREASSRKISEVFRILNEVTNQPVANPLEQAIAKGEAAGLANHTKLIGRNGSEASIDDIAAPIRDRNGAVIGGVLVFRDISEKRRQEMELADSAVALKRSNEELQQFAFAASHDLRSPLNSVNAIAQLLAKRFGGALGDEGREMIGHITESLGRMTRLIEDLLELAISSSLARQVTEPTSVDDALQAAIKGLSAEVLASGATITSASPLPLVAALDTHVIQMLQNLLGNALKYRGTAPPVIHVSAARSGSEWVISVKDNGMGFEAMYAEQIFEPFKRLHGREYEGSGIGLSTCRRIVSLYGGRIWAESQPNAGSIFSFSMPEAEAAQVSRTASNKG